MPNPNEQNKETPPSDDPKTPEGGTPPEGETPGNGGSDGGDDKPTYEELQQQLKEAREREDKRKMRSKRSYKKSKTSGDDDVDANELLDRKFAERDFKSQFGEERFSEVSKIAEEKEISLDDAHAIYLGKKSLDEQLQNQRNVGATAMHGIIPPREKGALDPEVQKVYDKTMAKFAPKKKDK